VDRELETICLKCLEKRPRRRYGSAGAIAEDLERWLGGEPIQARQAGSWVRVVKWARRRPALAGLSAVLVVFTGLVIIRLRVRLEQAQAGLRDAGDQVEQLRRQVEEHLRQRPGGACSSR
jgi:hypothetical protein